VSTYPNLFAKLIRRGWTDRELEMIAGENVLRAMARAENVARELQKTTSAPSLNCTPANLQACDT
jgi:membrane dipeptidase